jgi:hypothetical protein
MLQAPENKFDYLFQQKFKQVSVEGKLCQLAEIGCTCPVKS